MQCVMCIVIVYFAVHLTYLQDGAVPLREEAQAKCEAEGLTLAHKYDARAAFEVGEESCACGWLSDGSKVELVHAARVGCSDEQEFGLHDCDAESAIPICVDSSI